MRPRPFIALCVLLGCSGDSGPRVDAFARADLPTSADVPNPFELSTRGDMTPRDSAHDLKHTCVGPKPCCCLDDMLLNKDAVICGDGGWRCPAGWYEACDNFPNYYCHGHLPPPLPDAGTGCNAAIMGTPCSAASQCPGSNVCFAGTCTCLCKPDDPKSPLVNEDTCPNLATYRCSPVALDSGSASICQKHD